MIQIYNKTKLQKNKIYFNINSHKNDNTYQSNKQKSIINNEKTKALSPFSIYLNNMTTVKET